MTKQVNENTQNWFDGEVLEKLMSRGKLFKALKKQGCITIKNHIKRLNLMH